MLCYTQGHVRGACLHARQGAHARVHERLLRLPACQAGCTRQAVCTCTCIPRVHAPRCTCQVVCTCQGAHESTCIPPCMCQGVHGPVHTNKQSQVRTCRHALIQGMPSLLKGCPRFLLALLALLLSLTHIHNLELPRAHPHR